MKLYENKPNYIRLDDDVSFQILRTNPKLTTNTKLMYDGENMYMDAYGVTPLLSTMKYKHHRVWKSGLFNRDIRNFLLGTNTAAYEVGQTVKDTIMLDDFDNQFENTYWCGVEAINSEIYPQEMGCIAPLYLRKKRPNYFVIFKIDTPTNINIQKGDFKYNFYDDVKNRAKILKSFDLREGTVIGNYIKKYVEQKNFKYDQSIYVNFSSKEIYYYGIDKGLGVLTQKVENFEDQLLKNDNTILQSDEWITAGFERNNLIFPYIINLEFLFDDKETDEYQFGRYFGMYCNDIDLYDLKVGSCSYNKENKTTTLITGWDEEEIFNNNNSFCYIKDKENNIHSIKNTLVPGLYQTSGDLTIDKLTGFESSSVSTYAERLPGTGKAFMVLEIVNQLADGETLEVYEDISHETVGTFIATIQYDKGEYVDNYFSCKGTLEDTAEALASSIRNCTTDNFKWITAFNIGTKVVIQAMYSGENLNGLFNFTGGVIDSQKIIKINDSFKGGTNVNNCMFKVYTEDKDMFFDKSGEDRDEDRYLRCGIGRDNAKILTVVPYITEDKTIDDTYSVLITDSQGPYVNVSNTNQIEIIDLYYPKVGVLSFFPVRDFDFDTILSSYGDYNLIQKELQTLQSESLIDDQYGDFSSDPEEEGVVRLTKRILDTIPYKRFYDENKSIDTEYDYYCENIIPQLSVLSKSVPYITKWGYMDESKDSCENPYRLNTSKIFETCNFSANTFMQKGDISEYTHSMPYYIIQKPTEENVNEYQYLPYYDKLGNTYESVLEFFSRGKDDEEGDPFDEIFGDLSTTKYTNKRFNKKYSRFLLGNDTIKSTTFFRGVKFEITEIEDGKEVKTGKYNDYRFSFIYIPVDCSGSEDEKILHTVHFIKNDDYKFIVGVVFFDIKTDVETFTKFPKAYIYAGSMGFLKK